MSDESGFGSSLSVPYSDGTLDSRTVYVSFTPAATDQYNGDIAHSGGGASTVNITVTGTGTPPPVTEIDRGSGESIEDLTLFEVGNGENWNIVSDFSSGLTIFGDRDFTISSMPEFLNGVEWISTAMNSRTNTSLSTFASFRALYDGEVYIAHSDRIENKPDWLSEYEETDMTITVTETEDTERSLTIYKKSVSTGDVVELGINSNDGTVYSLMYIVLAVDPITTAVSDIKRTPVCSKALVNMSRCGSALEISFSPQYSSAPLPPVKLYSVTGRRISLRGVNRNRNILNIPVSYLSSGVYVIDIAGVKSPVMIGK